MPPMVIFAAGEGEQVGLAALLLLLGGGIQWLLTWIVGRSNARRLNAKEDEETAISRYEKLLKRMDDEYRNLLLQNTTLSHRVEQALLLAERAVTWIKHLEVILDNAKLPYRKWTDTPTGDTGIHAPTIPAAEGKNS